MDETPAPRFWKLSGAGNDFIAVLAEEVESASRSAVSWCRRALSLGADGLLVLSPLEPGRARLVHHNADGTRSDLCLNGSRCAARLAFGFGWAQDRLELVTDAGALTCFADPSGDEQVEMLLPRGLATVPQRVRLTGSGVEGAGTDGAIDGWLVSVGVPHLVVEASAFRSTSFATLPVSTLGPTLRRHPELGPTGANVDFVRRIDRHSLWLRTFERGVEGETLACGTGAVAAALVGLAEGRLEAPVVAHTAGGFALELDVEGDDPAWRPTARLRLGGDARLVAEGTLAPGAREFPPGPVWS